MKLKLRVPLFVGVVFMSVASTDLNATSIRNDGRYEKIDETEQWELVQSQQGIKVYLSKVENDNQHYVKIKFVNTANQEVEFQWSLLHGEEVVIDNQINKLKQAQEIEIYDASMLVPVEETELMSNFSLSINLK